MGISTATHQDFSVSTSRNALAIFCRAPRSGTVKTRLAATFGDAFALELYRAMLSDSFVMGLALKPDIETFVCFTPPDGFEADNSLASLWSGPKIPQCEGDLGDRMLDALAQLRSQNFQRIVLIGSDSPDLPLPILKDAFDLLKASPRLVFGPARDGGFFLIGASLDVPSSLFHDVEWSHSETLSAIRRQNESMGSEKLDWAELPTWQDVDDFDNLIELHRRIFEMGTHAPRTREFLQNHRTEIAKAQSGNRPVLS